MKTKLIDTPYGRKTPSLLVRAMDALEREPDLLAACEKMLAALDNESGRTSHWHREARELARAALARAKL